MSSETQLAVDPSAVREHLDRMLRSDPLRRSVNLSHLLRYLVEKALQPEGEHLKESVIAMDVFHRSGEFDSRLDNTVRVNAHRLRKLLDVWYGGEGANDSLRFVIPRGSYTLHIEPQNPEHPREHEPHDPTDGADALRAAVPALEVLTAIGPQVRPEIKPAKPARTIAVAAVAGAVLGSLALYLALSISGRILPLSARDVRSDSLLRPPLSILWKKAFRPGVETVASFTNPAFLRTNTQPRVYLTYSGPLNAPNGTELDAAPGDAALGKKLAALGPFFFSDSWTGTGEILAVHKLTEMAADAGYRIRMVRSRALTYADVKNSNVIFIGSPWANDMQTRFDIGVTPFRCLGTEKIVNVSPRPGEPAAYYQELDKATNELSVTYALFSVLPGPRADTTIVSSSGIDTYGTMAAVDLMTSGAGVRDLMRRFGTADKQTLPDYFQVIVRTEMIRGEPANTAIVAVRAVTPSPQPPRNR